MSSTSQAPNEKTPPSNAALIGRLLRLSWRHRAGCILVLFQQTTLTMLTLFAVSLTGLGIDVIRHEVDASVAPRWPLGLAPPVSWPAFAQVVVVAAAVVALALLHLPFRYWAVVSASKLVQNIVIQLRSEVYDKVQRLSFRFFDANETGSIINRVSGDVQAVRSFVDGVMVQVLSVCLSLAVYLTYMFNVHVGLTLACLATTPLLWASAVLFSKVVRPQYVRNRTLSDKLVLLLSESVQGVQVVKGFGREREQMEKFAEASRAIRDQKHKIFWQISLFQPAMGFLTQINMLVLLGYGGWLVIDGQVRLGEGLFVFANLLAAFATQVGQITNITNSIQASLTGAERVFEVLDAPIEIQSPANPVRMQRAKGHLKFENVSFCYQPGEEALSNVSFEVQPGQCVAIVGATGAGKTTLLNLLPRFYDPTSGRILLDGVDLRDLDLDDLRRNIGLVFQESFLFSNTVASNVAFGDPDSPEAAIIAASEAAAAHEFVSKLPRGYDTVIGEHGCDLSGGQRQRLALARALLLSPPVLVLDDPTSAIDPEKDREVMDALEGAGEGRTMLIVAHRLSTLRRADLVIVLDRGRIVQMGPPEKLLNEPGHYLEVAKLQMIDALESEAAAVPAPVFTEDAA